MSIEPMLVLSTGHLPQDQMQALNAEATHSPAVTRNIPHDYGVIIFVSEFEQDSTCSPELRKVIDYAKKQGCCWINFDRDADKIDGLPYFNWS